MLLVCGLIGGSGDQGVSWAIWGRRQDAAKLYPLTPRLPDDTLSAARSFSTPVPELTLCLLN